MTDANTKAEKETILFIHGMWGGGHHWDAWQPFFQERGWATLAPTLRHHDVDPRGEAPAALGTVSLLDYVADLSALIKDLPEKPVIIGHSMGGLIAQLMTARGHSKASVFLNPAPPAGWPATKELFSFSVTRTMMGLTLGPALTKKPHRLSAKKAAWASLNNMPKAQREDEYSKWVWDSGRVLFEIAYWGFDRRKAARVNPNDITVPTLTTAGELDRIIPRTIVDATAKRYTARGGDYKIYDKHAHTLISEPGWEQVAEDCATWIDAAVRRD